MREWIEAATDLITCGAEALWIDLSVADPDERAQLHAHLWLGDVEGDRWLRDRDARNADLT